MARSRNNSNLTSLIKLALENKEISEGNIIKLVLLLNEEAQVQAAEILNGVDKSPELPSPKDIVKIYSNWVKITDFWWNPLYQRVDFTFKQYDTITKEHPYTEDVDILLLKEKVFACTSKEQAERVVSVGGNEYRCLVNSVEENYNNTDNFDLPRWIKMCNASSYFETA